MGGVKRQTRAHPSGSSHALACAANAYHGDMSSHSFTVDRRDVHQTLAAYLRGKLQLSWSQAKNLVEKRRVRVNGQIVADSAFRLKLGKLVEVIDPSPTKAKRPKGLTEDKPEPRYVGPEPRIVYQDSAIVVVDKPPGLTTNRSAEEAAEFGERGRRFLPTTLTDLLPRLIGVARKAVRPVHRIDRDTSGLVVFALTGDAERKLGEQFRAHSIDRRYLALVRGTPKSGRIESHLVRDRGDGRRGSSSDPSEGQRALTHVRVLARLGPFSLVECRLETGRTHQVRIHLGEEGTPLCGERIYDRPRHGVPAPDGSGAKRPMLHATRLGLHHPETDEWLEWETELAADMAALLDRLRRNTPEK